MKSLEVFCFLHLSLNTSYKEKASGLQSDATYSGVHVAFLLVVLNRIKHLTDKSRSGHPNLLSTGCRNADLSTSFTRFDASRRSDVLRHFLLLSDSCKRVTVQLEMKAMLTRSPLVLQVRS